MTVQEIIDRARDELIGYDIDFALDPILFRAFNDEQRQLLEELVRVDSGLVFPGDTNQTVSVVGWAASYALHATFWRLRGMKLVDATADTRERTIQLVSPQLRHDIPSTQPSAYIVGTDIFPIDGVFDAAAGSRIYGWEDAATIDYDFITEPTDVTALTDVIALPDEARPFMAAWLAEKLAVRGNVSQQGVQLLVQRRDALKGRLFQLLSGYPGHHAYTDA
jgi:hypothetical protein